jgi:hypothetical protein
LQSVDKDSSYIWVSDDGAKDNGGITPREFIERYLAQAQDPPGFDLAGTEQVCELAPKTSRDEQGLPPTKTPIAHYAVDLDAPDDALIAGFRACEAGMQTRAGANDAPVYPLRLPCDLPYDFVASDSMRVFSINAAWERRRLRQFENQLDAVRKTFGSALRRRGPRAFGDSYSPDHGRRWCQYRVLCILDLDLFYLVNNEPQASHAELGNWLLGTQVRADPKDWGREARRAVEHARACLLSLPNSTTS